MTMIDVMNIKTAGPIAARMFLAAAWRVFIMTQCGDLPKDLTAGVSAVFNPETEEA